MRVRGGAPGAGGAEAAVATKALMILVFSECSRMW